jgi:hypothetical protein
VQDNAFFWAPRGEGEPSALKRARHASVAEAITHTSSGYSLSGIVPAHLALTVQPILLPRLPLLVELPYAFIDPCPVFPHPFFAAVDAVDQGERLTLDQQPTGASDRLRSLC